jgi:purine-binding chemotaxis protein CheW
MSTEANATAAPMLPDSGNGRMTETVRAKNHTTTLNEVQVVEFLLGNEQFAIDLFEVKEIVEYTRVTELPNTPPHIKGIIDLRGEIYTILDLKAKLKVKNDKLVRDEDTKVIVLDEKITNSKIGVMVDDVLNVSTFSMTQIDRSSASIGVKDTCIIGIIRKILKVAGKDTTDLVILIDIKKLLKDIEVMG